MHASRDGNSQFYQPSLAFFWLNLISTCLIVLTLVVGPFFMLYYFLKNFDKWTATDFDKQVGSVLSGLKKTNKSAIVYPFLFMVRRITIACIGIFQQSNFTLQIMIIMGFTLV